MVAPPEKSTDAGSAGPVLARSLRATLVVKAIDGAIELMGGIVLLAVPAHVLTNAIVAATRSELSSDPHDFVARHLVRAGQGLEHQRGFGAAYLFSHGAVKVVLVVALFRGYQWAYPTLIGFLGSFIAYQSYRFVHLPSISLAVLTAFDLVVVCLVWHDWRKNKRLSEPRRATPPDVERSGAT
ncbi:MAG TPA: DUF2127 domain-containing protein [Acidimicrobiales bacterium]|nr:DUF2127 domain-containing protein [Acidimicrobiales bacterium]